MLEDALLRELILTYALALVLIVALARLRIPPVVALIATGAIAGPGGIRIVPTQEDVQLLAEIGIVLLLFTVGLDFSLGDFRRVWRRVIGAGVLQIGVTAADRRRRRRRGDGSAAAAGACSPGCSSRSRARRSSSRSSAAAISSTRRMAGWSSASCCSRTCASSPCSCSCRSCPGRRRSTRCRWPSAGRCCAMAAVFLVSRFALPLLLGAVARSGRREAFSLAVVVASVGTGWISSLFGTSMALGAFLGGLVPRGKRVQPPGPCRDPSDSRSAGEPLLRLARDAARRRVPRCSTGRWSPR